MKRNFISVIIPAHNEESVISKAINSVLKSNYKMYEIIVVNDGSNDKTADIVKDFIRKYPKRIRILNYETGHSPAFARNRGAEIANGEILFFLDADDWVKEDTLENIIKAFEKYKSIDFIVGNRKVFVPNNWKRIFVYGPILRKEIELNLGKEKKDIITVSGHTACPYICKKKAFIKIGGFDEKYFYTEDLLFSKKLTEKREKKLLTHSIEYYTDFRSEWKDFKRSCSNVSKSLLTPVNYLRISRLIFEFIFSFFTFPIFFWLYFYFLSTKLKIF